MDLENDFEVTYNKVGRVTQGIPRKGYRLKLDLELQVPLKDTEYISKHVKLWDVDWAFKFIFDRKSSSIIISLNRFDEKDATKKQMKTKSNVRGTCLYSYSFDSDTAYPGEYPISRCDNNTFKIKLSERELPSILDEDHEETPDKFDCNLEWNVWEDEDDKYQTQEAIHAKVNRKPRLEELSKDMKKALITPQGNDTGNVTLRCLGKDLTAHKYILEARSSVFRTMFQSRWTEKAPQVVEVKDQDGQFVCPEVVAAMLGWIYTGAIENTSVNLDLLKLANFYDLHMLETQCQTILIDRMDKENVIDMLIVADRICAKDLKKKAMDFVILVKRELGEEIKRIGPLLLEEIAEIVGAEPAFIGALENAFERPAKRIKITNEITCKIEAIPSEMCRMKWEIDHIFPVGRLKRWKSSTFHFTDIKWHFYLDLTNTEEREPDGEYQSTHVIIWLISKKIPKEWGLSAKNSTLYAKYSSDIDETEGIDGTHYQSHPLGPDEEDSEFPIRRGDVTSGFYEFGYTDRNSFDFSIRSFGDSFQNDSMEIEFNLYWDQIKSPTESRDLELLRLKNLESLSNDLAQMLSNSASYDVWIKCQGIEIGAHREILSARSSFFETLFQKDPNVTVFEMNEVQDYPLDPGQVRGLLNWIYTGHFGGSDLMQMLKLGKYLDLVSLYEESSAILANSLTEDNVIDILAETNKLGIPKSSRSYARTNLQDICIYTINRIQWICYKKGFDEKISRNLFKLIYREALNA